MPIPTGAPRTCCTLSEEVSIALMCKPRLSAAGCSESVAVTRFDARIIP